VFLLLESALALSYIDDLIAVPYLNKVGRLPMVADIAVEGLKRISSSESVQKN